MITMSNGKFTVEEMDAFANLAQLAPKVTAKQLDAEHTTMASL